MTKLNIEMLGNFLGLSGDARNVPPFIIIMIEHYWVLMTLPVKLPYLANYIMPRSLFIS